MSDLPQPYLKALRIGMIGFFIALFGVLIGLIDPRKGEGIFYLVGLIFVYAGVIVFVIGFFWALVLFIETTQGKSQNKGPNGSE